MPRVIASIEARMGASRFPGKVLQPIAGVPALAQMIRRVRQARALDGIVVATTEKAADDPVADLARTEGVAVFRGNEDDVLDRVLRAQQSMRSEIVVELCGDCPLIDPAVIDRAVAVYSEGGVELVTTTSPQSYPQGMDVEVFGLAALADVAGRVDDPDVREHVSLEFYRRPDRYRMCGLIAPPEARAPEVRLLLDYPEDLATLDLVWRALERVHGDRFATADVLARLRDDLGLAEACRARLGQGAAV